MKKVNLIIIAIALFAASCSSSVLDKHYNKEASKQDFKELREELSDEDRLTLGKSVMRLTLKQKNLEEMTYQEILDAGKEFESK